MEENEILRIVQLEDRMDSAEDRIEQIESQSATLTDLVITTRLLAEKQISMDTDLKEIKSDVKELTQKPAKRWDSVVEKIIFAIIAAIVGFLLAQVGL